MGGKVAAAHGRRIFPTAWDYPGSNQLGLLQTSSMSFLALRRS
jgi:hypothetical protein